MMTDCAAQNNDARDLSVPCQLRGDDIMSAQFHDDAQDAEKHDDGNETLHLVESSSRSKSEVKN